MNDDTPPDRPRRPQVWTFDCCGGHHFLSAPMPERPPVLICPSCAGPMKHVRKNGRFTPDEDDPCDN